MKMLGASWFVFFKSQELSWRAGPEPAGLMWLECYENLDTRFNIKWKKISKY